MLILKRKSIVLIIGTVLIALLVAGWVISPKNENTESNGAAVVAVGSIYTEYDVLIDSIKSYNKKKEVTISIEKAKESAKESLVETIKQDELKEKEANSLKEVDKKIKASESKKQTEKSTEKKTSVAKETKLATKALTPKKEESKPKPKPKKAKAAVTVKTESISGEYMSSVDLNVRASHGTQHKIVGSLSPGKKAIASEKAVIDGSTWYKIKTDTFTGWASANYLSAYKKAPASTPAPSKKPSEKATSKPSVSTSGHSLNAQEQEMFNQLNQYRKDNGVPVLQLDTNLSKVARNKSVDVSTMSSPSHTSPKYGTVQNLLSTHGISYNRFAENLSGDYGSASGSMSGLKSSSEHNAIMLSSTYTHVGIGYTDNGSVFTQLFIKK